MKEIWQVESMLEECVDISVNISKNVLEEIRSTLGAREFNADGLMIVDGYIEFNGYKIAKFLPEADTWAVNEFKRTIGDNSCLSHVHGSLQQSFVEGK